MGSNLARGKKKIQHLSAQLIHYIPIYIYMKVLDFRGIETNKINNHRRPTHPRYIPTHKDEHTSKEKAIEFIKNVQREITLNTTQYYQNTK